MILTADVFVTANHFHAFVVLKKEKLLTKRLDDAIILMVLRCSCDGIGIRVRLRILLHEKLNTFESA